MIGRTISHYKVVDKLGEGGMGAVYKAEDTTLHRLVAIKALSSHLSENDEARERFVREAQAASSLNHSNITTVYELLEDEGEQFIVMEYVDGKTIRDVVESSRVSIRKAVDILIQAAEALGAAHNKGILHRDVKSANIMVSMEGNVKVMDFGLAHLEDRSQLTRTGTTMGTLAYSSPEQLVGNPVDKRSEIFSLGVVFYELLTGQLPFKSPSEGELVFEIINTEQELLTTCREDVPENVCSVVNKMLIKKPELRYQNCGELVSDLKAIQSEMETTTVQISGVGEGRSRARTRTIAAAIVGGVALMAFYFLVLASSPQKKPSLAVQPFSVSGFMPGEMIEESFAREIRDKLASIGAIDLRIFFSATNYPYEERSIREIGEDLDIEYLLIASVNKTEVSDGSVLVTVKPQLIRTDDASVYWTPANPYLTEDSRLIDIQPVFVQQLLLALGIELSTTEQEIIEGRPTENLEALRVYRQAIALWENADNNEDRTRSTQNLYSAISMDSTFAQAWAEFSKKLSEVTIAPGGHSSEDARLAAIRAIELNPVLPDGYCALGHYYYYFLKDWSQAIVNYEEALNLRPNDIESARHVALVYRRRGRWDNALEQFHNVLRLNPLDTTHLRDFTKTHLMLRDYKKARRWCAEWIQLDSSWYQEWQRYYYGALLSLLSKGDIKESLSMLEAMSDQSLTAFVEIGATSHRTRTLLRIHPDFFKKAYERIPPDSTHQYHNRFLGLAEIEFGLGNLDLAIAYFDSVVVHHDIHPSPYSSMFYTTISTLEYAQALVETGEITEGIRIGEEIAPQFTVSMDAFDAPETAVDLAELYVRAGEYEKAINQLDYVLGIPAFLSVAVLKIDPIWNPLRDLPEFKALLRKYR
ncbi:protein kinase [Gemmatimonadota bacterium]